MKIFNLIFFKLLETFSKNICQGCCFNKTEIGKFGCFFFAELTILIRLFEQSQSGLVEKRHWNKAGAYSEVDVEQVDMFRFPEFQSLPWWRSSLKPGDCIYVPKE